MEVKKNEKLKYVNCCNKLKKRIEKKSNRKKEKKKKKCKEN